MKIDVHRESLLTALTACSAFVPARSPKPILQNVKLVAGDLFAASDEGSALWATDLERSIRYRVANIRVFEPGAVVLPVGRLTSILRLATCDDLTIRADRDKIQIRGNKLKYDLPSEDPDLFPEPPGFGAESYHVVSAGDLKRMIGLTLIAVDEESTRYAMGGVCFEMTSDRLIMTSTDGRRISSGQTVAESHGTPPSYANPAKEGYTQAPVVPASALRLLAKLLKPTDPPVYIAVQSQGPTVIGMTFRMEAATFHSRLLEGRFPNWREVVPPPAQVKVDLPCQTFREKFEQAAVATSNETKGVDMNFQPGRLVLHAHAADVGNSETEMDLGYEGAEVVVTFDADYILDSLKAIDSGAMIRGEFHPREANVLRVGDDYTYTVMPLIRG